MSNILMIPIFIICASAIVLLGLSRLKQNAGKGYFSKGILLFILGIAILLGANQYNKYLSKTLPSKMYLENKDYNTMTTKEKNMVVDYYLHFNEMTEEELKVAIPAYIHYSVQWRMDYLVKPYDEAVKEVKEQLDSRKIDYSSYMEAFEINKK